MSIDFNRLTNEQTDLMYGRVATNVTLYPSRAIMVNRNVVSLALKLSAIADNFYEMFMLTTKHVPADSFQDCIDAATMNAPAANRSAVLILNMASLNAADKDVAIARLKDKALEAGYTVRQDVTSILIQNVNHKVTCVSLINEERHYSRTVILTSVYNEQLVLNTCVASFITSGLHLSNEYLQAILDGNTDVVQAELEKVVAERKDKVRTESLEKVLAYTDANFGKKLNLQNYYRKIDALRAEIERHQSVIIQKLDIIHTYNLQINEYLTTDVVDDKVAKEFKEYITSVPNPITYASPTASGIAMCVDTPLCYWDDKCFAALVNGRGRSIDHCLHYFNDIDLRLLNKIFITKEYTLMLNTAIQISEQNNTIRVDRSTDLTFTMYNTRIPNPHIANYNCWGNNDDAIKECIKDNDMVGMWAQVVSALSGIDFTDSAVTSRLFKYMYKVFRQDNSTATIIYNEPGSIIKKDGTKLSIAEAYVECAKELKGAANA